MTLRHVVATILLIVGISLEVLAVVGISAMRDSFDRLHYVSLAGYGALLVGIAILVRESFSLIGDKALLIGVLVVVLGPMVVNTSARSFRIRIRGAWREGIEQGAED
jgi:multisubunit Na+/H+ antiporter MnhG subunit